MAIKINPATKQLALQKLRDGLTAKQVADLTGVSTRTLERWKGKGTGKTATPGGSAPVATPAPAAAPATPQPADDEKTTLDFQDSPAPVEHKNVVDSAWSSLKGMLGMADKEDKTAQPVLSGPLDAKRKQFVESVSPTLSLAFMALASWLWGRIGPEYSILAPDDKTAQKIMEPLLRIYARHANFLTDVNPDVADIGASMFALVGYVHVSLKLYQQIKLDQEEDDEGIQSNGHNGNGWRTYRTTGPIAPESGPGNQGDRYADVRGGSGGNVGSNGSNGGHPGGVSVPNLSDKEARQYAALSRLGQLDFEHRARRSMRS